jgi:hypothetical protein
VTHICRLFSDKSCIKVLQKASQNCDERLKLAFSVTVTKCGTWGRIFEAFYNHIYIVTAFSHIVTNSHNWLYLWPLHFDRFCNIEVYRHQKSPKKTVKTSLLKLYNTSRVVTAIRRHKTELQMVTIVTICDSVLRRLKARLKAVTMRLVLESFKSLV